MYNKTQLHAICRVLLTLSFLVFCQTSFALSAKEIMKKVDAVDIGDNIIQDVEISVTNSKGQEDVKTMRVFRKKVNGGVDVYSMGFFMTPQRMKDTGFLSQEFGNDRKSDKKWMYFPNTDKLTRIGNKDKRERMTNLDFSHADLALRKIKNFDYTILEEKEENGEKVWVINARPNIEEEIEESGYTNSVLTVRQKDFMVSRVVNTVKKGNKVKQMDVEEFQVIDGITVPTVMTMKTMKNDQVLSSTTLKTTKITFGNDLKETDFKVNKLKNGL